MLAAADRLGVLESGAVDVTRGCQNGVTSCARWHDGLVVDLERIQAETTAYLRALDEDATVRYHFCHADKGPHAYPPPASCAASNSVASSWRVRSPLTCQRVGP